MTLSTEPETEIIMTPRDYLKKPYARMVVPEDDGSFRAEIAEFPGCIASGDTEAEALSELNKVAEGWLASVIARGQPIPPPFEEIGYSGKLVLRLSKSLHRKAAIAARHDGVSLNQFIVNSVSEQVGIRTAVTQVFAGSLVGVSLFELRAPEQINTGPMFLGIPQHHHPLRGYAYARR